MHNRTCSEPPERLKHNHHRSVIRQRGTRRVFFDTATVDGVRGCIEAGADPMARDEDENSPLRLAARYTETPAVIQALLAAGSDVEGRNGRGQTPLHGAADSNRNPSVAETLLNAGADPNARGRDEDTPLHVAAAYNLRSGDRRACDASISCWGGLPLTHKSGLDICHRFVPFVRHV